MVIGAGLRFGFACLFCRIRTIGPLFGTPSRHPMDLNTIFGGFRVDANGVQAAQKMVMFQWQDGKKLVVWPEELAPGRPRFPTPPWSKR